MTAKPVALATDGEPFATAEQFGAWLVSQHRQPTQRWLGQMHHAYTMGDRYRVDPMVMLLMSWRETGAGHHGGHVTADMNNPCGLRVEPNLMAELVDAARDAGETTPAGKALLRASHASYGDPRHGWEAFAQHIVAYLGPEHGADPTVSSRGYYSPRFTAVRRWGLAIGPEANVRELGNAWASASYGGWLAEQCLAVAGMLT